MDKSITNILSSIDDAINNFQGSIPGIQAIIYDELQPLIKGLDIKNGRLTASIGNMRILGQIKNKLQKVIVNSDYKDSVNKFIESFGLISTLNTQYYSQFNNNYVPGATLGVVRQLAIEQTINDLVGQGMKVGVIDPITSILNQNITSGGDYSLFQQQLRDHILTNDTGEGSLVQYTKQITTDAIHQYNAQYADTIAQDLNFNWGRYVGSLLTTSRQFCVLLTAKEFVHRSELPAIIHGKIDGIELKLSKTTKLPLGMIPGTNENNFKIRRGGYNCGHQFFWIPDNVVPLAIRNKFNGVKQDPTKNAVVSNNPIDDKKFKPLDPGKNFNRIRENNNIDLTSIQDEGIPIYEHLLDLIPSNIAIERASTDDAFYQNIANKIVIGKFPDREGSQYFKDTIMAHELGHAIHGNHNIIKGGVVRKDFAKFFEELQMKIRGMDIKDRIKQAWNKANNLANQNQHEQLMVIYDILGSLTRGEWGGGHTWEYYQLAGRPEAEIFAHAVSLLHVSNDYEDIDPAMKEIIDMMKEKVKVWLKEAADNS